MRSAIPLTFVVFSVLGFLWWNLVIVRPDGEIPSVLVGKPIPKLSVPPIPDFNAPGLYSKNLADKVVLLNFWSSWCRSCKLEHPVLMELSKNPSILLVGINYKDHPHNARRYLEELGNPFTAIGYDPSGSVGMEWGIYGQPETFIIVGKTVTYRHVGPLTREVITDRLHKHLIRKQ